MATLQIPKFPLQFLGAIRQGRVFQYLRLTNSTGWISYLKSSAINALAVVSLHIVMELMQPGHFYGLLISWLYRSFRKSILSRINDVSIHSLPTSFIESTP